MSPPLTVGTTGSSRVRSTGTCIPALLAPVWGSPGSRTGQKSSGQPLQWWCRGLRPRLVPLRYVAGRSGIGCNWTFGHQDSELKSDMQEFKEVAQRAVIAHLSPMCQGKILFKKTTEKKWKHHFPHYKSMRVFLRRSRAANFVVGGPIWPKFELIHNIMHVLVTSKFGKDRININGDYVMTSIF